MIVDSADPVLYHLTLQRQSNFVHSCVGHFVDYKHHQLVRARDAGKKRKGRRDYQVCAATETHIELYDVEDGSLKRLASIPVFAIITAMQSLPVDSNYSLVVLLTDAGNLSVLRFVYDSGSFRLHTLFNEPFARSGIRRLSPQKHLSVDLHGRCIFLSATERNKLCFLTDFKDKALNISSPLVLNKPNSITLSTAVCDVAFDNPVFASLEIDMSDGSKSLIFYMLDLGLNHIVQRSEHELPRDANFVISVPNLEKYGISTKGSQSSEESDDLVNPFVLIGLQDRLMLKDSHGLYNLEVQLPTRENEALPAIIIAATLHKLKKEFFILLQANTGDLFKVKIVPNESARSSPKLTITFFDTIACSSNLHIFRNGLMLALGEFVALSLYEFEGLGNDDDLALILTSDEPHRKLKLQPVNELQNLSLLDQFRGSNPVLSQKVVETTPLTILTQEKNTLETLTTGVNFSELISSPLPPNPDNVWTIRLPSEPGHRFVFLSLPKATMVLKIEDGSLEELELANEAFKTENDRTIFVGLMGENSIIQVCENSFSQIAFSKEPPLLSSRLEWLPPAGIKLVEATCSSTQLALGLSNNEIVWFELDLSNGAETLNEYQERVELPDRITALSLPQTFKSDFLAVGCGDSSVKIIGLKATSRDSFLEVLSMQVVLSPPSDLKLVYSKGLLFLHIGLDAGVYIRSNIDNIDGQLFDIRTKYLGSKPVKVSVLSEIMLKASFKEIEGDESDEDESESEDEGASQPKGLKNISSCAVLHSDKTWISYNTANLMLVRPLIINGKQSLSSVAMFRTNDIKTNGCCAVSSSGSLLIGRFDKFTTEDVWFQQKKIASAEEDFDKNDRVLDPSGHKPFQGRRIVADKVDQKTYFVIENNIEGSSCRISAYRSGKKLNFATGQPFINITDCVCLDAQTARFGGDKSHLVMSTNDGKLKTFLVGFEKTTKGRKSKLIFLHDTIVDEKVCSMIAFRDKLLVSLFGNIVLYGLGRSQLLKKSITPMPSSVTKVTCMAQWEDSRVAVGDIHESVTLFLYDKQTDRFISIADDITKRHVTALEFLDRSTVVGGDRFGNIWILRLPQIHERLVSDEFHFFLSKFHNDGNNSIARNIMECPFKWDLVNHFYANDIPVSFNIVKNMHSSDKISVLYLGLQGSVGCLLPLATEKEAEFLGKLQDGLSEADEAFFMDFEAQKASEESERIDDWGIDYQQGTSSKHKSPRPLVEGAFSLVGRDHTVYRSYYAPVKKIIDGDLCEQFYQLYPSEQEFLTKKLGFKSVDFVKSRLAEFRANHV
ncbi:LAQU0S03e01310g1_1 [Lachancea quebecensis]|uniref:LAQU0S03e01310g1_1 n=1 Tax=Lachancea quebecensis TaxID=1654605 RepID=A0A0P1KN89_9SACH|nr:LAQU0S03e01310g1_1 [Lachancea quebecensis]